jgi:hypothetical protein
MSSTAQSTVQHAMVELSRKLSTAIEEAMKSAEEHIAASMEIMIIGVSGSAHIERSCPFRI